MIVVADLGDNEMRKKKDSGLGQTHPLPKERSDRKVLQGKRWALETVEEQSQDSTACRWLFRFT